MLVVLVSSIYYLVMPSVLSTSYCATRKVVEGYVERVVGPANNSCEESSGTSTPPGVELWMKMLQSTFQLPQLIQNRTLNHSPQDDLYEGRSPPPWPEGFDHRLETIKFDFVRDPKTGAVSIVSS